MQFWERLPFTQAFIKRPFGNFSAHFLLILLLWGWISFALILIFAASSPQVDFSHWISDRKSRCQTEHISSSKSLLFFPFSSSLLLCFLGFASVICCDWRKKKKGTSSQKNTCAFPPVVLLGVKLNEPRFMNDGFSHTSVVQSLEQLSLQWLLLHCSVRMTKAPTEVRRNEKKSV